MTPFNNDELRAAGLIGHLLNLHLPSQMLQVLGENVTPVDLGILLLRRAFLDAHPGFSGWIEEGSILDYMDLRTNAMPLPELSLNRAEEVGNIVASYPQQEYSNWLGSAVIEVENVLGLSDGPRHVIVRAWEYLWIRGPSSYTIHRMRVIPVHREYDFRGNELSGLLAWISARQSHNARRPALSYRPPPPLEGGRGDTGAVTSTMRGSTPEPFDIMAAEPVFTGQTASTAEIFLRRPASHGANDIAHNLTVRYKDCFGVISERHVYRVRQFINDSNRIIIEYELYIESKSPKMVREVYDVNKHIMFTSDLGWVLARERTAVYAEYRPGTYSRAVSDRNAHISLALGEAASEYMENRFPQQLVSKYLLREFTSISEAMDSLPDSVLVTPDLILTKNLFKKQSKHFLLFTNMCIGELHKSHKYIKLYDQFTPHKPLLDKVINYEIR